MTERQQLIQLLSTRSVKRGKFVLASGKPSEIYIDVRLTSMSPEGLGLIGPLVLTVIRNAGWIADSIGGMTLGADPIAYAASYASNVTPPLLRAFTVRKEVKLHGTGRVIEGPFQSGDHVVIVEDVITTGSSALRAIEAVTELGGTVSGVIAVVDREEGGREALESQGYEVIPLVSISDIMSSAAS
jgi:orotate phosphoribosyltransferase